LRRRKKKHRALNLKKRRENDQLEVVAVAIAVVPINILLRMKTVEILKEGEVETVAVMVLLQEGGETETWIEHREGVDVVATTTIRNVVVTEPHPEEIPKTKKMHHPAEAEDIEEVTILAQAEAEVATSTTEKITGLEEVVAVAKVVLMALPEAEAPVVSPEDTAMISATQLVLNLMALHASALLTTDSQIEMAIQHHAEAVVVEPDTHQITTNLKVRITSGTRIKNPKNMVTVNPEKIEVKENLEGVVTWATTPEAEAAMSVKSVEVVVGGREVEMERIVQKVASVETAEAAEVEKIVQKVVSVETVEVAEVVKTAKKVASVRIEAVIARIEAEVEEDLLESLPIGNPGKIVKNVKNGKSQQNPEQNGKREEVVAEANGVLSRAVVVVAEKCLIDLAVNNLERSPKKKTVNLNKNIRHLLSPPPVVVAKATLTVEVKILVSVAAIEVVTEVAMSREAEAEENSAVAKDMNDRSDPSMEASKIDKKEAIVEAVAEAVTGKTGVTGHTVAVAKAATNIVAAEAADGKIEKKAAPAISSNLRENKMKRALELHSTMKVALSQEAVESIVVEVSTEVVASTVDGVSSEAVVTSAAIEVASEEEVMASEEAGEALLERGKNMERVNSSMIDQDTMIAKITVVGTRTEAVALNTTITMTEPLP